MIVGHQIGHVGIGLAEGDRDLVAIRRLDVLDDLHLAGRTRFGIRAAVAVEGEDHIGGGHLLAAVELDALAQLEDPALGGIEAFPALRQLARGLAGGAHLDQCIAEEITDLDRHLGLIGRRVEAVGAGTALQREHGIAALLRRRQGRLGQKGGRQGDAETDSRGALHESPPGEPAADRQISQSANVFHREDPPLDRNAP